MKILSAFSFLVHPSKHEEEQPAIGGTELTLEGGLGFMLSSAFTKASAECNIEIAFQMALDGSQQNPVRNALITVVKNPNLENARVLARKLQAVTTHRSGLGLLFVLIGKDKESDQIRCYVARFPADSGIVAEEKAEQLEIEFIEQVFMKSAKSYKAVVYEGESTDADFWEGKAVDKQISNSAVAISGYWIREFLQSDFKTTPANGTRRFALALRDTIQSSTDLEVKEELTALASLAKNINNKVVSIENLGDRFGLSGKALDELHAALKKPSYRFTKFTFSAAEFRKHVRYRQTQLDNGATLSAPADKFDECFQKSEVAVGANQVEYRTRGRVVNEGLRKGK